MKKIEVFGSDWARILPDAVHKSEEGAVVVVERGTHRSHAHFIAARLKKRIRVELLGEKQPDGE